MSGAVRCDRVLLWSTLLLVLVGMLTVYSASAHIAQYRFGGSHELLKRTVLRAALGFIVMLAAYSADYRLYRKHAKKMIVAACGLLALVLFMPAIRGMRGFISMAWFTLQPTELAKLGIVIYLADVLSRQQGELGDLWRGFLPRIAIAAVALALIALQPDYGSALAVLLVVVTMLFLAGARMLHLAGLALASSAAGLLVVQKVPEIAKRLDVWRSTLDLSLEGLDMHGAGYQIYQSLVALGSGGLFGRGVGGSLQRAFIPDAHTDFAFSIWGEEVGLVGSLGLVALFVFFFVRGLRVAGRAPDLYGRLLAAGATVMITTYAVLGIGVACAALPTTGLPLPFISYGGSSLVVNMCAVGILLNISRQRVTGNWKPDGRRSRS